MTLLPFDTRGAWRRYTTADGLAAQQTEHIVEDGDGYLWIATVTGGVSRFDGEEFRNYTTRDGLPSDQVLSLCVDRNGRLWCGTWAGLCWLDGDRFRPFEGDAAIAGQSITFLFEDSRGSLWIGGPQHQQQSVYGYWDGERYTDLGPRFETVTGGQTGNCWGICEDRDGAVWFAGAQHVVRWADGQLEHIDLPHRYWHCIAAHPEGGVWHGSGDLVGIWRDGIYEALDLPISGNVFMRKMLPDRQDHTWFCLGGSVDREVAALCSDGRSFWRVGVSEIGFNVVNGFHEDREGGLWFATWGGGLTRFDPAGPFVLGSADGLPSIRVGRTAEDRDRRLWVQFSDLISPLPTAPAGYFENGRFSVLPDTIRYQRDLLPAEDGGVWFAGAQGVCCWRHGRLETVIDTAHGEPRTGSQLGAHCLAYDRQGRLLVGVLSNRTLAILRLDGGVEHRLFEMEAPGWFTAILAMVSAADGLWFGVGAYAGQGPGYGLGFLDDAGEVTWYLPADGLAHPSVEALHIDRAGHLWVATLGGINRFDGHTFTRYTTAQGLPHNHVRSIAEDEDGGLWFGTDAGVARFDGQVFNVVSLGVGSPVRSMTRDHTGQWWFATMEGLVGYRPSRVPPRVRMVQTIADRVYEGAEAVTTSVRQLVFEFKGMSFRISAVRPREMLYTCRLEGYDEDWQPPTRDTRVHYQDLPIGEYVFAVKAIDRDLNYSEAAQVQLSVEPDALVESLTVALGQSGPQGQFVGHSPALHQVQAQLRQVAPSDLTVLILGETGTGKGLAARILHELSPQRNKPFILVSCGSIPQPLMESELFGHEKGAFTGAASRRLGKVELAGEGTLFLDEIADLPLEAQGKLLRLLEERTYERVGGTEVLSAQGRVVAATNRDLRRMVAAGTFREDLYFRLQGFEIQLPPLRARLEDIRLLALYFIGPKAAHLDKQVTGLSRAAEVALAAYDWPGNVRELQHTIERAVVVCQGETIGVEDVLLGGGGTTAASAAERVTLEEHERRYIQAVLEDTAGRISGPQGAARILGMPGSTLRNRMKKLGIKRS